MGSEQRKIFVGGLSWETTEDVLSDYFTSFGEVVESTIVRDRITGNARGFGFVQFSDASAAEKALKERHVILERTVEVKRAITRGHQHNHSRQSRNNGLNHNGSSNSDNQSRTKKIFVGGLPADITEEVFKSYFEKFGNVTDVVVMYDNLTNRPRGFGFISFDSEDVVDNLIQKNFYDMNGKEVEVKKAVPKDENHYSNKKNNYDSFSPSGRYEAWVYPPYSPRGGYGPRGPLLYPGYAPFYPYMGGYTYNGHGYGYYGIPGYINGGVGVAGGHPKINMSIAKSEQKKGGDDGHQHRINLSVADPENKKGGDDGQCAL